MTESLIKSLSSIVNPSISEQLASVYIIAYDRKNRYEIAKLQYFPESLSDNSEVDYASKNILGGSHPIYQWIAGSGRNLEFEIVLSRENISSIPGSKQKIEEIEGVIEVKETVGIETLSPIFLKGDKRNVDIDAAVNWLRSLTYPTYESGKVYPPPILTLIFGKTIFRFDKKNWIDCIMTSFSVEYKDWFNDGTPRLATCSVAFSETIQKTKGKITYIGRNELGDAFKEKFIISSGRTIT